MIRPNRIPGIGSALLSVALLAALGLGVAARPVGAQTAEKPKEKAPAPEDRASQAEEGVPTLAHLAVCEDVQDRVPVGEGESFPASVGYLWCFTDVRGAAPPTQVFHRWYVGDKLVAEIPINVRGKRWRCWSKKTIRPSWSGPCRVEVLTEEGDLLGSAGFALE